MLTIKAGEIAGKIWTALNEKGTLTGKELKKACGKLTDKDLFLGLGWLLREEKTSPSNSNSCSDSYFQRALFRCMAQEGTLCFCTMKEALPRARVPYNSVCILPSLLHPER